MVPMQLMLDEIKAIGLNLDKATTRPWPSIMIGRPKPEFGRSASLNA